MGRCSSFVVSGPIQWVAVHSRDKGEEAGEEGSAAQAEGGQAAGARDGQGRHLIRRRTAETGEGMAEGEARGGAGSRGREVRRWRKKKGRRGGRKDKARAAWSFRVAPPRWPADLPCHVGNFGKLLASYDKKWQKYKSHRKMINEGVTSVTMTNN